MVYIQQWDENPYSDHEMCTLAAYYYDGTALDNVGYNFMDLDWDVPNDASIDVDTATAVITAGRNIYATQEYFPYNQRQQVPLLPEPMTDIYFKVRMCNMEKPHLPEIFRQLQSKGLINPSDILKTPDGFWMVYKSLSNILSENHIYDFPNTEGERLPCSKFYDDWFLYAVPGDANHSYSLIKLREQEHDLEDGSPADGDHPGVTVSFISVSCEILLTCLTNPSDENRMKLDNEINRVVAHRGQTHDHDLKRYFLNPKSLGSYLVADLYTRHIAAFAKDGYLDTPEQYRNIAKRYNTHKSSKKLARLPEFIEGLNRKAGYILCDHDRLYIQNPEIPTPCEAAAILATHTGNTSVFSFAAEVEYHARYLTSFAKIKIPFFGRSVYDSAIRADMSVGDTEIQGPTPFYRDTSKMVKRQYMLHPDKQI